jgi:hypothetical protein
MALFPPLYSRKEPFRARGIGFFATPGRSENVWWADAGTRGMKRAESESWASDAQYANRHAEVRLLCFQLHAPLGGARSSGARLAVPVNVDIWLNHLRCGKRMTMGTSGRW